ncbi:MAG: hypothetical protein PVG38_07650 [Gammaproteobacteria bacterium]|jgi:hypothetical protein
MRTISRKVTSYLVAGALVASSLGLPAVAGASAYAYEYNGVEPSGGEMLADAFLVRPFMLVGTVLTTATFIVTLPFSALGGNVDEAATKLVAEPASYTFVRPLGEM